MPSQKQSKPRPDQWSSKQAEDREYQIPGGRLWRVYRIIERNPKRLLRPTRRDLNAQMSVERVLEEHGVKSQRGSSYYTIECPNPEHEDRHPSCVVWPSIRAWKCYSCGASGDLVALDRLLRGAAGG